MINYPRSFANLNLIRCHPVTPHVPLFKTGFHIIYHMSHDSSASDTQGQIDHAGMKEAQLFILNK